jgi:hypothetical protein
MKSFPFVVLPLLGMVIVTAVCGAEGSEYSKEIELVETEWADLFKGRPMIAMRYGLSAVDRDGFTADFGKPGALDLQLGYTNVRQFREYMDLVRMGALWVAFTNFSTDMATEEAGSSELESKAWRFAVGISEGAGYSLGSRGGMILPYHSWSMGWSVSEIDDMDTATLSNKNKRLIEPFDDDTRFGTSWEGGLRIVPVGMLAVEGGYEQAIVFPRTKFWYWAMSSVLEEIALGVVDEFVDSIADTSPKSAPIVGFLLKSGLEYGVYELRQEKMNWPFDTSPPLTRNTLKFGVCVTF